MKEAIFQNSEQQAKFEEQGFIKLQLFSEEEIGQLKALYAHFYPEGAQAFYSSSYSDDYQLKTEISEKITELLKEGISRVFTNYKLIGSAFLIKGKGDHSEMPMHQDWTIVDEHQFYAANVWIPLTETTEENGTIEVLKGSHQWKDAVRAPSLPFFFEGHQNEIMKHLTSIPCKIGEVVVLNQAVIHYSKPNQSTENRPAITCGLLSEKAPLIFHYFDPEQPGKIEVFDQEDDFLLQWENFHESIYKRPMMGKSKGFVDYQHPKMTIKQLHELVGIEESHQPKKGFFSKLFGR